MILDTSVVYESLIDAPLSAQARALMRSDEHLRAPDLILVEIAGAITRAVRRGELKEPAAILIHEKVRRILPETDPSEGFVERAFSLSLELRHPVSDCIFLAQAEAQADILVTADQRLLRKLSGTPHAARAIHVKDWRP